LRAGCIYIKNSTSEVVDFVIFDPVLSREQHHFADEALKEATQELLASTDDALLTSRCRRPMHSPR
jgi:hypothetical protein